MVGSNSGHTSGTIEKYIHVLGTMQYERNRNTYKVVMRSIALFIIKIAMAASCIAQNTRNIDPTIVYSVNSNVENSEKDYFKAIQKKWEDYLNSNRYLERNPEHWDVTEYAYPEMGYASFLMYLRKLKRPKHQIQCSTVGIIPVQGNYFLLKTIFTEKNITTGLIDIKFIVSVYAKKGKDGFKFYSGTQYYKETNPIRQVGNIRYIVHPKHQFNQGEAQKMSDFNERLAAIFAVQVLDFEYVVANNTRDLSDVFGLNFFQYSYQPVASGGMADNLNGVIYAGNNSEYYPHEVVHLYTHAKFPRQYHPWVDEGIAALLGGSTGYKIEWHWEKVRRFLMANPDFKMDDLTDLEAYVPNGEFITDFRYAIGALLCKKIVDKEGMQGLFDALRAGTSVSDYYGVLERKLGVTKNSFEEYVKSEIKSLEPINDTELEKLRY